MRDPEVQDVSEAQSMSVDATEPVLGPALTIDIDRLGVQAVLLAEVEGQGRFVAAAREGLVGGAESPHFAEALQSVIQAVEEQSGISVVTADNTASEEVLVALTGYPAPPIRMALLPAGSHSIHEVIVNAVRTTPTILEVIHDKVRTDQGAISGAMLEAELRAFQPDMAVLIAGDAAKSEWATMVGTLAPLLKGGIVGQAVILGSNEHQQQVIQTIGEDGNLMGLDPNEYDAHEVAGAVEIELQGLYDSRVAAMDLSALPTVPAFASRARSLDIVTRFLARRAERSVLSVSIDDGTSLAWATGDASAIVTRPELDISSHVRGLLNTDLDGILGRLPFSLRHDDLRNWIMNRSVRPEAQAVTERDRLIEAAMAGAVLDEIVRDVPALSSREIDLIVAGPTFAWWGSPAIAVLTLLGAVQPRPSGGVLDIIVDGEGVAAACGAIGELTPAMAADTVEHDLAHPVATVVLIEGDGNEGDLAVRGELVTDAGDSVEFAVPFGSIHRLPLAEGAQARLEIVPDEGFAVVGSGQAETVVFEGDQAMRGSELGILIDARGRGHDDAGDPARMASWLEDLGVKGPF